VLKACDAGVDMRQLLRSLLMR